MENIKITYTNENEIPMTYSFEGEWIAEYNQTGDPGYIDGEYSAARTKNDNILILFVDEDGIGSHEIYSLFDEIDFDNYTEEFLSKLAVALDLVYWHIDNYIAHSKLSQRL